MDRGVMKDRNVPFSKEEAAILKGYSRVFNKICKTVSGGGYANIVNSPGSEVEGVAYEVTENGLLNLDVNEGCDLEKPQTSSYLRKPLSIILSSGEVVEAQVYIATESVILENLKPKKEYMYNLLVGALQHNLSDETIRKLITVETVDK